MKKVAALQTQKGPWSRDVSSTVKKGLAIPSIPTEGSRQKKVLASQQQALQQQKGPWSRQEHTRQEELQPSPPSAYSATTRESKRNKVLALQEQKGPWNRSSSPKLSSDSSSHTRSTASPRHALRRGPNSTRNADATATTDSDFLDFDASMLYNNDDRTTSENNSARGPPPPPPPPPALLPKGNSLSSRAINRLETPQQVMCFCTAMSLFRKQWAVLRCSETAHAFHIWRRVAHNIYYTQQSSKQSRLNSKAKTEHSVLLWLATNSRMKHLRFAWKKWMYAVIAWQNQDKTKAIDSLSAALTKENEQYKLKLVDIMAKVKQRDGLHRHSVVSSTIHSYFRVKGKLALKRRFDTWSRATWQMSYDQTLRREKFKMEIGFQAISSEKEVLKETEVHSSKLQSTLLCLVAFSSWKLKMKQQQFTMAQQKWAEEKKVIQDNLMGLQKSLLGLNRTEREMVDTARTRGMEMYASLHSLSDKLSKCSLRTPAPGQGLGHGHMHGHAGAGAGAVVGGGILKKKKKKLLFEEIK
jgi:hypothetical protein